MSCPTIAFQDVVKFVNPPGGPWVYLPLSMQLDHAAQADWIAIIPGLGTSQPYNPLNLSICIRLYKGVLQQAGQWISTSQSRWPDLCVFASCAVQKLPWNSSGQMLVELISPSVDFPGQTQVEFTIIGYQS
jgi:hypothetical protein